MRKLIMGLIACCLLQTVMAQQSTVKGKILDTLEHKELHNAVISLLLPKDSTLYKYTRSDQKGNFQFSNIVPGKYVMLITYPKFADFSDAIEIKNTPENDLGAVALTLKSQLLQAVIVRNSSAIHIKGDTTEFVADSFHVKDGATVEDLLKKLPGFQVNAKGEITAQGQKVQKVLVDGEEFFGDDPTMATQNIGAKAVDKVQVYDTKSDQEQLTGISSGNDGKTVNIKLKEDKKKGAFGKFYAGTDFNKYYDGKALYNKFLGKKKFSAFVTKSNVNAGSLDWQDRQKLGLEDDMEYDEIGGFYYSFGTSDEFSDWGLQGLPKSTTAGALFSNKWNEDKQGINGSYNYNKLETNNDASTKTQQILENTVNYRNKYTTSNGLNEKHSVNGKYEWKIDSLASLKFTTADLYKTNDLFGNTKSEYLNAEQSFINNSTQSVNSHNKRTQSDNQLTYKQLFKKKDRIWLTSARFGYTQDDQNQILVTRSNFYKDSMIDSTDLLDQMKKYYGESKTLGLKTTWSEPLSPKTSLVLEYAYNQNNAVSDRLTYNKSNNGKYEELDPLYSNNFDLKAFSNSGTAIFKYTDKKLRFAAGSGASSVKLRLFNKDNNEHTSYDFNKLTPQAQLGYAFKPQTRLSFSYRGTTIQPNINQLQPIRDNNDPLNIFVGNPDLKLGFRHSISAFYNQYKVLKQSGLWLNAGFNVTNNAIVNSISLDTTKGKQTYMPVNVNGNQDWYLWTSWHKGEGEKKLGYGLQINGNGGRGISFLNGKRNETDYYMLKFRVPLNYDLGGEKGSFYLSPEIGYNNSISSLQPDVKNHYFSYGGDFSAFKTLPWKMEISTDLNVDLQQRIRGFAQGSDIFIWNANLTKKIFKDKSGKIIFSANDLLDKNKGFNRIISSNYITENRYSRISRYFLLKFEWSFNKMPGTK